ncbi:hypothetical protein CDIK_1941 [Cucumispora dikerogammari]|nr:hypothetical protein CDIK_1941 [Cucumispora dikerogammari]
MYFTTSDSILLSIKKSIISIGLSAVTLVFLISYYITSDFNKPHHNISNNILVTSVFKLTITLIMAVCGVITLFCYYIDFYNDTVVRENSSKTPTIESINATHDSRTALLHTHYTDGDLCTKTNLSSTSYRDFKAS